jgi:hypothetical protein
MKGQSRRLDELYSKSDAIFLEISAYFKKLLHDHKQTDELTIDQRKILKLFNYNAWEEYMKWVDEKLEESGETGEKQSLPEIL